MKFKELIQKTLNSPDKRLRPKDHIWSGIIIHHTSIGNRPFPGKEMWDKLQKNIANWLAIKDSTYVSAHFLISRHGEIWMLVDPQTDIAFHAGKSEWFDPLKRKLVSGINDYAIGIELLGDGNMYTYSDEQYDSLIALVKALREDFTIEDPRGITGHENIAPGRKNDPGQFFDWDRMFKGIYS